MDNLRVYAQEYDEIYNAPSRFELLMNLELQILATEVYVQKYEIENCVSMDRIEEPTGIEKIRTTSKVELYNGNVFKWLACSFKKAFFVEDQYNIQSIRNVISRVERFFKGGQGEGFFGEIWKANVKGFEDLVLIKVYKTIRYTRGSFIGNKADTNIHEFFIGYFLNQLRTKIPNFMFVYGLFTCEGPANSEICPATNGNLRDYLLMESIQGTTFKDFISTHTDSEIFAAYLQIILSVALAYEEMDYTHYDLHTGNVLIQELDKPYLIRYTLRTDKNRYTDYFVLTKYLAKIIDYGTSHVNATFADNVKKSFGNFYMTHGNVEATKSNPYHDLFKITGFTIHRILEKDLTANKQRFMWYFNLMKFFRGYGFDDPDLDRKSPQDIQYIFDSVFRGTNFSFRSSYDFPTNEFAFRDFLTHINIFYGQFLSDQKILQPQKDRRYPLYSCVDLPCSTVDELNDKAVSTSILEKRKGGKRELE